MIAKHLWFPLLKLLGMGSGRRNKYNIRIFLKFCEHYGHTLGPCQMIVNDVEGNQYVEEMCVVCWSSKFIKIEK